MAVVYCDGLVSRSVRGTMYRVSEFVHVCAIYLGIAVLVTMALSSTVPSLRNQARQIHEALLIALRPDGFKPGMFSPFNGSDSGLFGPDDGYFEAPSGQSPSPGAESKAAAIGTGKRSSMSAELNFRNAMSASMAGGNVEGLTSAQAQALRSYIARKYKIAHSVAGALISTAFVVAQERSLDPQLVLAVIAIESRYNPYAESHVGAQGLMQVMTNVHKDKFEALGETPVAALNPIANIRVGVQILHDCIKRRGSIEGGLACYVGATGPGDGGYGAKVLAERRRIALASGIPVGR